MSIFYHVSTNLRHDGVFTPRIPDQRHQQAEDNTTGRVSVAPSIELCLTAIPGGGGQLDELNINQRGYYLVFRIDTEKLGISEQDIVKSQTLYKKDFVRDAGFTEEHWILSSFTVPEEDRFIIRLYDWEEFSEDVLPYSIFEIADREYDGDYLSAYMDIYDDLVPCSVRIQNIQYTTENLKKGDEFTLYFDTDIEKDYLISYIKTQPNYSVLEITIDEIKLKVNKDVNAKELFLYHAKWLDW